MKRNKLVKYLKKTVVTSSVKGAAIPCTGISATAKRQPFHDTLTLRRTYAVKFAKTSAFRIFSCTKTRLAGSLLLGAGFLSQLVML